MSGGPRAPKPCPTCSSPDLEMLGDISEYRQWGYVRCNCGALHYMDVTHLLPPDNRPVNPKAAKQKENIAREAAEKGENA